MRKILLRFDDICPTMDWDQWNKAKYLLDKIGATALLGVIPDCQDPVLNITAPRSDFWSYLKELQTEGYVIAMHGYQHVFDIKSKSLVSNGMNSEFAGHPYEVQYNKIKKGKDILESHGIYTDVFFAPAHSYDINTLKALAANGFKYISDGKSYKPYVLNGVTCIPCRSNGIPSINKNGYYTVVLHAHEWARDGENRVWNNLRKLCEEYNSDITTFGEYKKRKRGCLLIQLANEKIYMFYRKKIVPVLVALKHYIENR